MTMHCRIYRKDERGVVLVVGLVMLILITLTVLAAFRLSGTNLLAVGNMQFRTEALAAANKAIEVTLGLSTPFSTMTEPVDLNNDGTKDYTVALNRTCIGSTPVQITAPTGSGCSVTTSSMCNFKQFNVVWDYAATVSDSKTGAAVAVHQGIRQLLTQAQCNSLCPPAAGKECS